jgi:putative ABC transport system permease protein
MRALDIKLVRDLRRMSGQVVAIALVIAAGTATFVMSVAVLDSLRSMQSSYYERYRFADVFVQMKRAPQAILERLAAIPGVRYAQGRLVREVTLDVQGLDDPATGRFIAEIRDEPSLNARAIRMGRTFEPGSPVEAVVSEPFAQANGLLPGAKVSAVLNGRLQELTVVGIALSPEFVYQIRAGEILPDDRRFGVFWVSWELLANAFDMEGAFNDATLALDPDASVSEVLTHVDRITEPWGGFGAYARSEQTSHRYIDDELKQLRGMALIAPTIFLVVAAFLVNMVVARLVGTQREQIATLKAFGYTNRAVGAHYLKLVMSIVAAGVALGVAAGAFLAHDLIGVYARFFRFPIVVVKVDPAIVLVSLATSAAAGAAGVVDAVRRAVVIPPAGAMRPEAPARFASSTLERIGLRSMLGPTTRMILRQLEQRPVRTALSCIGIALAVGIMVLGSFVEDTIEFVIDHQFQRSQRQDLTITLSEVGPPGALHTIRDLPGVRSCEAFRSIAARVRSGHRSRRVGILGIEPGSRLWLQLDEDGRQVPVPQAGILLSEKLAEILGVRVGDRVTVEVLEGRRPVEEVPVVAVIRDFTGTNATMSLEALRRLTREEAAISGAFVACDERRVPELFEVLKSTPRVAGVSIKDASMRAFEDTVARSLLRMRFFNILFSSVIAFGVVYNSARVALSERARDFATLRILGFTRGEISAVMLGELAILGCVALPIGLGFGYAFAAFAIRMLETETHRFPLVIEASTYAYAAIVVIIAGILSALVVRRRLDRLDLVAVLKAQD